MEFNTASERPQRVISPFELAQQEIMNLKMRLGLTILGKRTRDPNYEPTVKAQHVRVAILKIIKRYNVEAEFVEHFTTLKSHHELEAKSARSLIEALQS